MGPNVISTTNSTLCPVRIGYLMTSIHPFLMNGMDAFPASHWSFSSTQLAHNIWGLRRGMSVMNYFYLFPKNFIPEPTGRCEAKKKDH